MCTLIDHRYDVIAYVQTHAGYALIDLLFYKISSFSKFDILKHSGLFLVQLTILDVLASAKAVEKY